MFDDYLTINQLAKLLGVKFYQIRYLHQAGYISKPNKIGNTLIYQKKDIEKVIVLMASRGDLKLDFLPDEWKYLFGMSFTKHSER